MDPAYWQQLGQWEEWEALETLRWYEQERDRLNNLNCENDHEHSDLDFGAERDWQEQQPQKHGPV